MWRHVFRVRAVNQYRTFPTHEKTTLNQFLKHHLVFFSRLLDWLHTSWADSSGRKAGQGRSASLECTQKTIGGRDGDFCHQVLLDTGRKTVMAALASVFSMFNVIHWIFIFGNELNLPIHLAYCPRQWEKWHLCALYSTPAESCKNTFVTNCLFGGILLAHHRCGNIPVYYTSARFSCVLRPLFECNYTAIIHSFNTVLTARARQVFPFKCFSEYFFIFCIFDVFRLV